MSNPWRQFQTLLPYARTTIAEVVAVNADGGLRRIEVVGFHEPQEYLPKEAWVRQMDGRRLDAELSLGRAIRPLSGGPLTAHALVDASRRGLALFQVLYGAGT